MAENTDKMIEDRSSTQMDNELTLIEIKMENKNPDINGLPISGHNSCIRSGNMSCESHPSRGISRAMNTNIIRQLDMSETTDKTIEDQRSSIQKNNTGNLP